MRRLLFLLCIVVLSAPGVVLAWSLSDHREMSHLALVEVAPAWGLESECETHPLQSLIDKLRPLREELGDAWHFSAYLQLNPKIDLGAMADTRKGLTPLEILTIYSTDPDDGRDQDLFLRDEQGNPRYAYPDQKWFGAVKGSNSQAFRHIEKPPFNLFHPLSRMGLPFRHLGEATRRAEIYFQLSRLAFSLEEEYWGWRFLASSFHYIEDLHQPYHAGQLTPVLLYKGLKALSWGWKKKGLIGTFGVVVSNSHRFFESYVALNSEVLEALKGTDIVPFSGSVETMARDVRDTSNRLLSDLTRAVSEIADPKLDGPYEYRSDEEGEDDPLKFLNKGPEFTEANRKLFEIVQERFGAAGRALRTATKIMIDLRKENSATSPSEILSRLDGLLASSTSSSECCAAGSGLGPYPEELPDVP